MSWSCAINGHGQFLSVFWQDSITLISRVLITIFDNTDQNVKTAWWLRLWGPDINWNTIHKFGINCDRSRSDDRSIIVVDLSSLSPACLSITTTTVFSLLDLRHAKRWNLRQKCWYLREKCLNLYRKCSNPSQKYSNLGQKHSNHSQNYWNIS